MKLTQTCVSRPVLVAMIMLGLSGIGLFCYGQLAREIFPDVEFPVVTVSTIYQGAGPEETEQLISKRLEDEISSVEGIKHLWSISQQGVSVVMAEFYLETDVDVAAADVRAKVNVVRSLLPEAAEDPVVMKFDFNAQPIMKLAVSARRTLREVYHAADNRVKDRLASVPDVASVTIVGGEEREIHVIVNQQRLRSHGLSITDVAASVAAANLGSPGGPISQNSREYNIRLQGRFSDLDQLRNMKVTIPTGKSIYLRDIAQVKDAFRDVREKARANGQACVGLNIQKRAGGNTIAVDAEVRKQIEKLLEVLPADFEINILDEGASWITSSISNVMNNIVIGIVLTAVALFLFLHSFRAVLIISLSMPIAVMAIFLVMYLMDITVNMMSLMGLAMTIGVLVNNSILVLENITRYIHLGQSPDQAAVSGTDEIAVAVSSTTLTNVVVFVPIAFMGGIVGQFFKDFGLTATFATIISLFVSFTLAPMMAAKLLNKQNTDVTGDSKLDRFGRWFDSHLRNLQETYARSLKFCLRHRLLIMVSVIIVFLGSLGLAGQIGVEFFTSMDQGKFIVSVEMPVGTRFEETDRAAARIEAVLADRNNLPELVSLYSSIGRTIGGDMGGTSQAVNITQILVTISEKTQRTESTRHIMDRLRPILARAAVPGARIKMLESDAGGGGEAPIMVEIIGDDINRLNELSQKVMAVMSDPAQVAGTIDVDTNYRLGQPEIRIIPDREKCRDCNLDTRFLAEVVAATFEGVLVSEYREGAFNYDIRVRSDKDSRRNVTDIHDLTVMNSAGDLIPLPEVARIQVHLGPAQIFRKDRQNIIVVSCDVTGRSAGKVAADIKEQIQPLLAQYPDCRVFFGGSIEMMVESFIRLAIALIMAVCLTYMLLASLLESFTQPLIIMFSLPLSLVGVFVALFLMGGTFSIFSLMSIIMLVGLVINNSIIVIDYINILRRRGVPRHEAIIEAGATRLRPILMANLTTVIAMIPLALGLGWGGEMRAPMAMVMIGGLIAGGGLGLLIIPVVYTISDDFNNFVKRLVGR